mgnify:CR=1 FL=1
MSLSRVVEYAFFFGLLLVVGYFVWLIFAPFLPALALSAVVVTICYPLYVKLKKVLPGNKETISAALMTLLAVVVIIIPVFFVSSVVIGEVYSFYQVLGQDDSGLFFTYINDLENLFESYIPGFELNIAEQIRQGSQWFVSNLGTIFAGTASTVFLFFISIIGIFYCFRDGARFTTWLVKISHLAYTDDTVILNLLATAVRSVVTGVVLVSIIQGIIAAAGFSLFGIERAVLWASVAAIAALLPGIGTSVIMIPAIVFLFFTGSLVNAIGLLVWAIIAVIVVDNFIGPYLMSRGNNLHPFVILLSVLGGITLFGPIGFVVGPVILSLFMVLLEIYSSALQANKNNI